MQTKELFGKRVSSGDQNQELSAQAGLFLNFWRFSLRLFIVPDIFK